MLQIMPSIFGRLFVSYYSEMLFAGPTNCGKSTLLRVLTRRAFYGLHAAGSISVNGVEDVFGDVLSRFTFVEESVTPMPSKGVRFECTLWLAFDSICMQ